MKIAHARTMIRADASRRRARASALLCATALPWLIAISAPAHAQNTTTGDVRNDGVLLTPGPQSDPLVSSFNLWVGDTGTGTLTIAGGADGTSVFAVIGRNTGTDGTVTVQDAGSTWTNTNQLDVGLNGKGVLKILNGGAVSSNVAYIGNLAGSVGEVTVDGGTSSWTITNSNSLTIGRIGNGTLTISGGGGVVDAVGSIGGETNGTGAVTVTGANSKWTNSSNLYVGDGGTGTLDILDGGSVSNTNAFIGTAAGTDGTVTVDGANTKWTNSGLLHVGESGTGTLDILNGGTVSSFSGYLGFNPSGTGAVTVTNARWTVGSGGLYVGQSSTGTSTLDITDGGVVTSSSTSEIGGLANSHGEVTVDGAGAKLTSTSYLYVGNSGNGTLTISNGGVVSNGTGGIGFNGGSSAVTVEGLDSTWTNNGALFVGRAATSNGTLTIRDGGVVTSGDGSVGTYGGATGTVVIDGAESKWTSSGGISVADVNDGTGRLTLSNGGMVEAKTGVYIGYNGLGTGTLAVGDGDGSIVVNGGNGVVSVGAHGVLEGHAGSTLTMSNLTLDSGAKVNVALGAPSTAGLFTVVNDLVLDGTVNITDAGGFGDGLYRLFDYGGTLTDSGLNVGAVPSGKVDVQTSVDKQVNLYVTNVSGSSGGGGGGGGAGPFVFWDGAGTTANGAVNGGSGTWNAADTNWTTTAGDANGVYDPAALLIFAGTAGTATVDAGGGALPLGAGMQFANGGFVVKGDGLALGAGTTTLRVGDGTAAGAGMTATIASKLTGAGGVDKTDIGTLILTAANSYAGGTTISGGTLRGSATSFGAGAVTDNAALVIDQASDASFANAINGMGAFTKTGAGRLDLTGTGNLSGATTVQAGTLAVNGSLRNSVVTVRSGASVGGTGTIGGLAVEAGGTVAPGNSIGTLNVAGGVTFAAGSIYAVEANAQGQADKIAATGAAAINGGKVSVLAGSGDYGPATSYTILTADGGVNGKFEGVTSSLAFLTPSLGYGANVVTLTLTRNAIRFADIGGTPNQKAAGAGVDSLGQGNTVWNAAVQLDAAAARGAFDRLSGEIHPSVRTGLYDDSRLPREAVLERLSQQDAGKGPWMQLLGDWGTADSDGNASRLDRSAWGMFGGADGAFGAATLGIAGGYTKTRLTNTLASRADLKSWHVLGYAGAALGAITARAGVGYARADIATRRAVGFTGFGDTLNASTKGSILQGFGEIGYRIAVRGGVLEPFAGIAAVRARSNGLTERGGAAALTVKGASDSFTSSTLGLKAATTGDGPLFADVSLGWRHNFGDRAPVSTMRLAGGDAFVIAGTPVSKDAAALSLAAGWRLGHGATLTARYSGTIGGSSDASAAKLALGMRF